MARTEIMDRSMWKVIEADNMYLVVDCDPKNDKAVVAIAKDGIQDIEAIDMMVAEHNKTVLELTEDR